jgi:hypothetical protein
MRNSIQVSLFSMALLLASCDQSDVQQVKEVQANQEVQTITESEKAEKFAIADSISNIAQATLLKNISQAIKAGGTVHAVDFCNIQAVPLMDSVSKANKVKVERVTEKNRNPDNYLKTENDKSAWVKFKDAFFKLEKPVPFIQEEGNQTLVYYKPIAMGMPTCLKCHGAPVKDIDVATAEKINEKYPNDLATNYKMGDFRGMWKVTFER